MQNNDNEEISSESSRSHEISKDLANNDILDSLPEDMRNQIPEAVQKQISRQFSISVSSMGMRKELPFEKIMTSEHLSTLIQNADKDSERELENQKLNKKYLFWIFMSMLVFIVILILILVDKNPNLLMNIISYAGTAILGIAGGYGLKVKLDE